MGFSSGPAPLHGRCFIMAWCSALFAAGDPHVGAIKHIHMRDKDHDSYSEYLSTLSLEELLDIHSHISQEKHPDRYELVKSFIEIKNKEIDGVIQEKFDEEILSFDKYKTFWKRFSAGFIDAIIFIPLAVLNHIIWGHASELQPFFLVIWYIIESLSFSVYSILMHGKYGQTIGKVLMDVKVIDVSEKPLTFSQAILRDIIPLILNIIILVINLPKIFGGANILDPDQNTYDAAIFLMTFVSLLWFLAEVLTMLTNKKRRALHDYIAGSVVIKCPNQCIQADAAKPRR